MPEVHVEQLVGRRVLDTRGRPVGRLHEVRAERVEGDWIVTDYVLGVGGLIERLAAGALVASVLGAWAPRPKRHVIPWDALDLSEPERPRLTRPLTELRRLAA
jgi:sporulation protein YlmC with PRC-barrel domain